MDRNEAWELFKASKLKAGKAEGTIDGYKDSMKALFEFYPDKKNIEDFTGEDLERFILTPTGTNGMRLRSSTQATRKKRLNVLFAWLKKREIIKKNPVIFVETIVVEGAKREAFTPDQLEKLIKMAPEALAANIKQICALGKRPPEDYCRVDPKIIDLENRIAKVYHSKISRWTQVEIIEYPIEWLKFKEWDPTYYKRARTLAKHFKNLCIEAGLPNMSIYNLRHTYCTILAAWWKDPMRFMAQVGWTNVNQARTYVQESLRSVWAKFLKQYERDPMKEINEKLDEIIDRLNTIDLRTVEMRNTMITEIEPDRRSLKEIGKGRKIPE